MTRTLAASSLGLFLVAGPAAGATITIAATQTGGFYADGLPDNFPGFQNYHVGYGTSIGFERTSERRAFYWFEIPDLTAPIVGATVTLTLATPGGLIFGKGPGDPEAGPVADDPFETFVLSATPFGPEVITSPGLTLPEAAAIFGTFAGPALADPVTYGPGIMDPPDDGKVIMPLNGMGLAFLAGALGGDMIFTGFMPTWSHDERPEPGGDPGDYFEAHELFFALSDVHTGFPAPVLTIFTADIEPEPVPEPGTALLLLGGGGVLTVCRWRRRR